MRFAVRLLRRQPGFATVAIVTLAIGIGANSAIFSLVNGVLFRSMPYEQPERLVTVWTSNLARGVDRWGVSLHDYTDWQERSAVFTDLAAYNRNMTNVSGLDRPQRVIYTQVTPSLFSTLGVTPMFGRTFADDENLPGNDDVIVVSHNFWKNHLGAARDAVASTLTVDGRLMTVVGVMPAHFAFPDRFVQLWKPFGMLPEEEGGRGGRWVRAIGRLGNDVSLESAQESLTTLGRVLETDYPESNTGFGIYVEPLQMTTVRGVRRTLLILWGTAGLVLLIACVNIANLLLAKAAAREREIAVRAAMGASKSRIMRQLVSEAIPLSILGAAGGVLLALLGVRTVPSLSGGRIPRMESVAVDSTVLVYSLLVSLAVGILFSILPALRASKLDLAPSLKEGIKTSEGRRHNRMRNTLVVTEIALAMVVVTGAGLLVKSLTTLLHTEPGFAAENALTIRIAPSWKELPERARAGQIFQEITTEIAALPGVRAASGINRLPLAQGNWWGTRVTIEGREPLPEGQWRTALTRVVLPGYHATMEIPIARGRSIAATDDVAARKVTMINQAMAEAWWPDGDPIGSRINLGDGVWRTIVAVAANALPNRLGIAAVPMLYVPFPQAQFGHFQDWGMSFVIRTKGEPTAATDAVRSRIMAVAPNIPLFEVATLEDLVQANVARERFNAILIGLFAAIALVLAAVGVYGVMAYLVSQRTKEIGVRVALGVVRANVIRLVLARGMSLAATGIVVGALASVGTNRLLSSMLFETSALDPVTYAGVAFALAFTALVACAVPAFRATRVDPLKALRAE